MDALDVLPNNLLPPFRDICSEERRGDQYKSFRPVDDNVIFDPRVLVLFATGTFIYTT